MFLSSENDVLNRFPFSERVKKFVAKESKKPRFSEMSPEDLYIEKVNNGLYTLERVTLILAEVCVNGPAECLERATKMFRMKLKNCSLHHHLSPVNNFGGICKFCQFFIIHVLETLRHILF